MPSIQKRGNSYQLRVKSKLLPKPFFQSFPTFEQADTFGRTLESLLDRGIVPQELLNQKPAGQRMVDVIDAYIEDASVTDSDKALLKVVGEEVIGLRMQDLDYAWAEAYVSTLKRVQNLAPGTIRKRVGVLGRVTHWSLTKGGQGTTANPFRLLPVGYSAYSAKDVKVLPAGKALKRDVERNRRLTPAEEVAIRQALSGVKREGHQRALEPDPDFTLLFALILDTGLRLKEAYRLRQGQIDLAKGIINVEGSKGHRGKLKPRTVPLKPSLADALSRFANREAKPLSLLFPYWDGEYSGEYRATSKLSARFSKLFEYAGVDDFTEHDLRHEACCRWVELKDAAGRWTFSDVEVCRIMGWSNYSMILRYASLRGEDLAARLR